MSDLIPDFTSYDFKVQLEINYHAFMLYDQIYHYLLKGKIMYLLLRSYGSSIFVNIFN